MIGDGNVVSFLLWMTDVHAHLKFDTANLIYLLYNKWKLRFSESFVSSVKGELKSGIQTSEVIDH